MSDNVSGDVVGLWQSSSGHCWKARNVEWAQYSGSMEPLPGNESQKHLVLWTEWDFSLLTQALAQGFGRKWRPRDEAVLLKEGDAMRRWVSGFTDAAWRIHPRRSALTFNYKLISPSPSLSILRALRSDLHAKRTFSQELHGNSALWWLLDLIYGVVLQHPLHSLWHRHEAHESADGLLWEERMGFALFLRDLVFSICSVFQLHAPAAPFSVTATCASTTHWCATAFRTVFTPGTRTTARVSYCINTSFCFLPCITWTNLRLWVTCYSSLNKTIRLL